MIEQNQPMNYAGFISYRHLSPDKEIAHALHKLLEHNMIRPDRSVPRNIKPVFLDIYELPLVEDLDQSIKDALDHSECLFVVCSPNLPLSKYCMEEIRYFKQRHGGTLDRIYTILVDGEPADAFVQLLRTKILRTELPDGSWLEEEVAAEPLFADVRGKSLVHSYWKLLKSEYLRLAAAYYKCSFDKLYKRSLRWTASAAILLGLLAGAVCYGFHVNSQALKADAITSHAEQSLSEGDELLAMTLCEQAEYTASQRYQAALRSAVAQYDYKKAVPVSETFLSTFLYDSNSVRYLSEGGDQIITKANAMLQITDAVTGVIHLNEPQDHVFVTENNPDSYIRLHSRMDEDGIMRDYVSMYSLSDFSLIREFSYRISDRNSSSYSIVKAVETDTLLYISDGGEPVAYMSSECEQLSKEEFVLRAENYLAVEVVPEQQPYKVVLDKRVRKYAVQDQNGNTLLHLDGVVKAYAFSDDMQNFVWLDEESLYVYDTGSWDRMARLRGNYEKIQRADILWGSSYVMLSQLVDEGRLCRIYDWESGKILEEFLGNPIFSPKEQAFFVAEKGSIVRYEYHDLELNVSTQVLAHTGKRVLAAGSGRAVLMEDGRIVLDVQIGDESDIRYDGDLNHVLIRNETSLTCFGTGGAVLWAIQQNVNCFAAAEDGSSVAWLDEAGVIRVLDAGSGEEKRQIDSSVYAAAGNIHMIAVSRHGVCAAGNQATVWIPADGEKTILLNTYASVKLYSDGMLILEDENARVLDFMVYDVVRECVAFQPENNTGAWDYSPDTGWLIRHVHTSGNNATMTLELLKRKGSGFVVQDQLEIPSDRVELLRLDSSGQWLSAVSGGRTMIHKLKGMEKWLDAACRVYFEDNMLYGDTLYGSFHYSLSPANTKQMLHFAAKALESEAGKRELTEAERIQYCIE